MRYDEYQNKVKKAAGVKKFFYRFRFLFLTIVSIIAVTGIVLFNTKGLITSSTPISQMQYYYGQDIQYNISGFLTSQDEVGLEFQVDGQWTVDAPNKPGNYPVRPYSTNNYGGKIYGNTQTISIAPKPVTLSIKSTSVDYGEKPEINILDEDGKDGLVSGDTLTYDVKYTNLSSSDTPDCYVDLVNVKVEDPKGRDVTECYSFTTPASPVRINKRTLVFNPGKTTLTYDGSSHDTGSDIERIKNGNFDNGTSLLEGDQVVSFPSVYQFMDVGTKSYTYEGKDFKIVNSDGVDVTRHYNLNIGNGEFDITPAELVITSGSVSKSYDGSPIEVPSPKVDESTPLQGNDILKVDNLVSPFYKVGEVDNTFDYDIVDKDNPSISHKSNYHITVNTGKLTITKALAVHVNVSKTDGFVNKYVSDFEVNKDNLIDYLTFHTSDLKGNDTLTYDKTKKNYNQEDTPTYTYDVESNTYTLQQPSLHIVHEDGDDVTDCYESVSFSDGHQNITDVKKKKVDIYLVLPKTEYEYKGAPVFKENDLQMTPDVIDGGVKIQMVEGSLHIPTDYQEEAYTIKPEFRLMNGSDDVTDYYDVEVHSIDVKVKKTSLWINIVGDSDSLSKTYDGDRICPEFEVEGLINNDVDGVHHIAKVSFDDPDYGFQDKTVENNKISLDLNIEDAGKYHFKDMDGEEADAAFKRILKWHIYDSEDISANEVTSNYDVHFSYEDKTINIAKKQLEIKFDSMIHYYDGKPFSAHELEDNYKIVGGDDLKLPYGQKLEIQLDKDYKDIGTYSDFQNHISEIRVVSEDGIENYTQNYDIDWKSNAFSLTIKKVKIVYFLDSTQIITDPSTNIPSVPYGNKLSYPKEAIKFADSSDFRIERDRDEAKNKLEENYELSEDDYYLESGDTTTNIPGTIYPLTMEDFKLEPIPNSKYQKKYGYDTIDYSKIDFTMYGLDGNKIGIRRRQLNLKFSVSETNFLYDGKNGIGFGDFQFLLKNNYIGYSQSLASGDHLQIEWKPGYEDGLKISGDYTDFREQTFSNIQDMIKISVVNEEGNDVTNYYSTDNEGKDGYDNAVSGKELKIEGSFSVTYEKPRVTISLKNDIDNKSIKAYDNTEDPKTLFELKLENTGFDVKPELDPPNTEYSTSRVGEYHFNVTDVTFSWNDCPFSWQEGSIECKGKTLYTLIVNRLKLTINYSSNDHVYWYDGKELTLDKEVSDGEASLYGKYTGYTGYFKGLYKEDEIHFERMPGGSLPKDESVDAYSLLDNFRITVRHKNDNGGFEDVTGNYCISIDDKETPLEDYLWKFDDTTLSYKRTEEPSFERFYIYKFSGTLSYKFDKTDYYKSDKPIFNESYQLEFTSNLPDSIVDDDDISKFNCEFDPSSYDENSFGAKYPKLKKVKCDVSGFGFDNLNTSNLIWEEGGTSNTMDLTIKDSSFNIVRYPATVKMKDVRLTTLQEDVTKKPGEISLSVESVNSVDGKLTKDDIKVTLKDTVNLSTEGENIIHGDDVVVTSNGKDGLGDYKITVKDFKLTYEKPTLMITMNKSDFGTYDGNSHHPGYSVKLFGLDGKEMPNRSYSVSLTEVQYNQSFVDAGIYSGFEITDYKVKVNNKTYSKDDFEVQYQGDVNYEIKKQTLMVNAKSFKASSEYVGLSTSEIASRLKDEIKKNPNTYLTYSGLLKDHLVSDFKVEVVIINNGYYYMITPTKIVDASGNDVTENYQLNTSMKAPLIIQVPASDDDFE